MCGAARTSRGVVDLAVAVDHHAVFQAGTFAGHQAVAYVVGHAGDRAPPGIAIATAARVDVDHPFARLRDELRVVDKGLLLTVVLAVNQSAQLRFEQDVVRARGARRPLQRADVLAGAAHSDRHGALR